MNDNQMLFIPFVFFLLIGMLFPALSGSNNAQNISGNFSVLFCPFPDYYNGINQMAYPCSAVNHPQSYTADQYTLWNFTIPNLLFWNSGGNSTAVHWVGAVPIGVFTYLASIVTNAVHAFVSAINVVRNIYLPPTLFNIIALAGIVLTFYIVFLTMFGMAFWKLILSPIIAGIRSFV